MLRTRSSVVGFLTAWLLVWTPGITRGAAEPELVSVTKLWDKAPHNAFTDLIRWRSTLYCTFREADAHVGGDGKLRVLESVDGKNWQSASLIQEQGIDLRDPK